MLSEIVVVSLYRAPGFVQSSLFTFLDRSYELYRLEQYQQSGARPTEQESSSSPLATLATSIGKGSLKLLGMLNVIRQEENRKYLLNEIKMVEAVRKELLEFGQLLEAIQKSM